MMNSWSDVFVSSLNNVWLGFANFVPNLIVALLVFILAWVLGSLLGRAVKELFVAIKLDRLMDSVGLDDLAKKSGMAFSTSSFLGGLVRWFIIIVGLVVSLNVINLSDINIILVTLVTVFLPKVAIATIVLIVAAYVSKFVSGIVAVSSKSVNAGRHSMMFATIAKYAIWIFAFMIALGQLGIARELFNMIFTGIVFMLALAGGLAFGIGGKEHASRVLDKVSREMSDK
jgi:hypothetical protein